jgi:hypothetical protein
MTISIALCSEYLNSTSGMYSLTLNALANIFIDHCPTLTKKHPIIQPIPVLRNDQVDMLEPPWWQEYTQGYLRIHEYHVAVMPHQPPQTLV